MAFYHKKQARYDALSQKAVPDGVFDCRAVLVMFWSDG